jgi:hypothetical protein
MTLPALLVFMPGIVYVTTMLPLLSAGSAGSLIPAGYAGG